jgi:hypothetical protein
MNNSKIIKEFAGKYLEGIKSFNDSEIILMTPEIYFKNMEILVNQSIPLNFLIHISFGKYKDYYYFKNQLDEKGITSDYVF